MPALNKTAKAAGHVALTPAGILQIKFTYDPVVINKIKTLSNRLWHSGPRHWTAPCTVVSVRALRDWGFEFDKALSKWLADNGNQKPLPALDFGELDSVLDDYQKEGVQRIEAFGGRALLADDPGLGKTPQILTWLRLHPELRPVVVVPKKSGKLVWQHIAKRGLLTDNGYVPILPDDRVQVIYGEADAVIDADIVIANYDIIARVEDCPDCLGEGERAGIKCKACKGSGERAYLREDIAAINPVVVVLDEPQQISNRNSQRTAASIELGKRAAHVLGATASPIKRRPKQFFNVLNLIRPDIFPSFWNYGIEFCAGKHNGFGWSFEGASNTGKLYDLLKEHVMIRRRTADVLTGIPAPVRQVVPLDIVNRGEYEKADADFMGWLADKPIDDLRYDRARKAEGLVRATTLLHMAAERKTDAVIEWIRDFLEDDGKLIVFTMHTALLDKIITAFPTVSVKIDGSSSARQREEAEERFQNDPECLLFVGNSDAAGDTITLTAAHDVAFAELPKTPEDVKQNEGRAYARKNDPHGINSWFLVAADTIEEKRAEQLNVGARVVNAVLDGKPVDDGEDLIDLISTYRGGTK